MHKQVRPFTDPLAVQWGTMWCTIIPYGPCCGRKRCGLSALPPLQCQLAAKLVASRFYKMERPLAGEEAHKIIGGAGFAGIRYIYQLARSHAAGSIWTGLATLGDRSPVAQLRGLGGGSCHNITCAVFFFLTHPGSHTTFFRPSAASCCNIRLQAGRPFS